MVERLLEFSFSKTISELGEHDESDFPRTGTAFDCIS
jgi:hypothetical protein